jgi:hypothetical protein
MDPLCYQEGFDKKTSLKAQNFKKPQVVVDLVALAFNFSPFSIKHQNGETKWTNPIASPKIAN